MDFNIVSVKPMSVNWDTKIFIFRSRLAGLPLLDAFLLPLPLYKISIERNEYKNYMEKVSFIRDTLPEVLESNRYFAYKHSAGH